MVEIKIYKYNYGDRILVGKATKDPIDGKYYLNEDNVCKYKKEKKLLDDIKEMFKKCYNPVKTFPGSNTYSGENKFDHEKFEKLLIKKEKELKGDLK